MRRALLVLALALLPLVPAGATEPDAAVPTVKGFYDIYLQLSTAPPLRRLEALQPRLEPALYDPLRQALKQNDGNLGFDPFTVFPAAVDGVHVEPLPPEGAEVRLRVRVFSRMGNRILELYLRDSSAGWRIANVVYDDGRDLLTLLKDY